MCAGTLDIPPKNAFLKDMKVRTRIITVLLGVAYLGANFSGALSVVMPALGSGPAEVRTAVPLPREAPKPTIAPRRHLPLVKLITADQLTPSAQKTPPAPEGRSSLDDGSPTIPPPSDPLRFSSPRAPPLS
jgi:hypothetical protein